jgi:transcriptional regulator with XRE-family HTH domain
MQKSRDRLGQTIKEMRQQRGLSQIKLAEILGVSYQQVQKYEKGKTKLSVERLRQLAGALGVPVAALLSGEPDRVSEHTPPYGNLPKPKRELLELWDDVGDEESKKAILNLLRRLARDA